MGIFGLGPTELILILVVVMLLFGVGKLPEVGAGLGRGIREFKESISGGSEKKEEDSAEKPEIKG